MKKYKYYFILVLSLFVFLLSSCDNKEADSQKSDDTEEVLKDNHNASMVAQKKSHTIVVGDVYNPFYALGSEYTFKSTDEKICKVNSKGDVEGVAKGNAHINVYKDNKIFAYLEFKVTEGQKINYNYDENLYNELMDKVNSYNNDNVSLTETITSNGITQTVGMRMKKEPFYYEMNTGSITYVKQSSVNNNYFMYTVDEANKKIKKSYIEGFSTNDYSIDTYGYINNLDDNKSTDMELNKISDNKYNIKTLIGNSTNMFKGLFGSEFDEYLKQIQKAVIDTTITLKEKEMIIDIKINMHVIVEKVLILNIPVSCTFDIIYDEFNEFDSTGYELSKPTCFQEVEEEENLDEFTLEGYTTKYAYMYFKKGRYVYELTDDLFHNDAKVDLYNKDLTDANYKELTGAEYLSNVFNVKEDGYYYISIDSGSSADHTCKLTKLDEVDNNELEFKTTTGTINSKYDYKTYVYSSTNDNEASKLTNLSSTNLYLYSQSITTTNFQGYTKVEPNKELYINPEENSVIYVVSAIEEKSCTNDFDYKYDYSFKVESIINDYGTDYDNLVTLSTEFDQDDYMIGYNLPVKKALLKAEKPGLYYLYSLGLSGKEARFSLYLDTDVYYPTNGWYKELPAGEYVVNITANDHAFDICKIRYTYVDTSDRDINITLPLGEGKVKNEQVRETQKIRYFFTLEEDSYLLFNPEQVTIFDLNDKALTIKAKNTYDMREYYFKLKAGSYYLIYRGTWYLDDFTFGKATTTPTEFVDIDNVQELISGEKYDVAAGYNNCGFGKVTATTTTLKITHNRARVTVFDENMDELTIDYVDVSTYTINVQQGKTYYIFFVSRDVSEPTYIICRYEAFNKSVNITIPVSDNSGYVKNEQTIDGQVIKYNFTLEEDSYLCFNPGEVSIFDLNGKPVVFASSYSYYFNPYFYSIKAGSYYATYNGTRRASEFVLFKAENVPSTYIDVENIPFYVEDESYSASYIKGVRKCGYGKFTATEDEVYIFNNNAYFEVYDENMNKVDSTDVYCSLEKGKTYYIFFVARNLSRNVSIKYKYNADVLNRDVNISLPTYDSLTDDPYVKSEQVVDGQLIRYFFTLEEDLYLIFNPGEVVIYDLNDNRVSFMSSDSIWIRNYSFKVKAGSYYAIFSGTYFSDGKRYGEEFVLCTIKSSSNPIDIEKAPILTSGETYNAVGQDKGEKFGYGKFVAKEAEIKIINSNAYVEVYDENMNRITTTFINAENNSCTLEKGKTYYILFANRDRINDATIRYEYV